MKRLTRWALLVLAVSCVEFLCSGQWQRDERSNDVRALATAVFPSAAAFETVPKKAESKIVFGMTLEPVGFYPLRAIDSASYYVQTLVYEGLVKYNAKLEISPALAQSWTASADGLKYSFRLRSGLHFSDGAPLGLIDVIESFKLATARGSPFRADFNDVVSFEAEQEQFVVKLKTPNAAFLSRMVELRILPAKILRTADQGRILLSRQPISSGPFKLIRWQSGLELVFAPNPYYWGDKPGFDLLVWRIVPDKTMLALALDRGELDLAQIDALSWSKRLANNPVLVLERFAGTRTVYLGFNCGREPFKDVGWRKAVAAAIDKEALVKHLYQGYARVAVADAPAGTWYFDPKVTSAPFDPRLARAEISRLTEQLPRPIEGFRILTIKEMDELAEVISSQLHEIGIANEVQILEYTTLKRRYLQSGDFSTFVWSRSAGPDPEAEIVWGPKGPLNYVRFQDARLADLLKKGRQAFSREERRKIYGDIQALLAEQLPWDFLVQPDLLMVHSKRIGNVKLPEQANLSLPWDNPFFNAARWVKPAPPQTE
jgi:peptide/nickel transport system substrate-binding protein